jgi:hypothetical protein
MGLLDLPGSLLQFLSQRFLDWSSQVCLKETCSMLTGIEVGIVHISVFLSGSFQHHQTRLDQIPVTALQHVNCLNIYCALSPLLNKQISRVGNKHLQQVNFFGVVSSELPWLRKFVLLAPPSLTSVGIYSTAIYSRLMETDLWLLLCEDCTQRNIALRLDMNAFSRQDVAAFLQQVRSRSLALPRFGVLDVAPKHTLSV